VQDDEESINEQISSMASIYTRSYFTIVAASGPNDDFGLVGVGSPRKLSRIMLQFNDSRQYAFDTREWLEGTDVWHSRAWTFQERVVSRRCLVFYKGTVKWECTQDTWLELLGNSDRSFLKKETLESKVWPDFDQYASTGI
jgi:hypothetical protein